MFRYRMPITPSPQAKRGVLDITVWSGGFDLPHPAGSTPYRLIVREYEFYPREWGNFQPNPKASDDGVTPDSTVRKRSGAGRLQATRRFRQTPGVRHDATDLRGFQMTNTRGAGRLPS